MDNLINSAAILTAALLRDHPNASTEKMAELLERSLHALELAIGRQNTRNAQKHAALKNANIVKRQGK